MPVNEDFVAAYQALTGYRPLEWQRRLFGRLAAGDTPPVVALPTALGKTSIIPIWLIALAQSAQRNNGCPGLPRRLVYIVNRRTVVDQATDDAMRLLSYIYQSARRDNLCWATDDNHVLRLGLAYRSQDSAGNGSRTATDATIQFYQPLADKHAPAVAAVRKALAALSGDDAEAPLAVSTLRGELADNGEWKINPARPAIIIGTIDMIGSKLLFSGYGDGRNGRAHHAGLIGQDTLVVHDEAHLTPAFSVLLRAVEEEQQRELDHKPSEVGSVLRPVRVMELSATIRADAVKSTPVPHRTFALQDEDRTEAIVQQRLCAEKRLSLTTVDGEAKDALAKAIVEAALNYRDKRSRVLIYVRKPDDADTVARMLREGVGREGQEHVGLLTGTIRGYERDRLVESKLFKAFRADPNRPACPQQTLYLVSTSAGEVGVDLDADHLVCDLTTLDSMVQRFGRVNRLGVDKDGRPRAATIIVVVNHSHDEDPLRERLQQTAHVLHRLPKLNGEYDASPHALEALLRSGDAQAAFAPAPEILPATDVLLDAWSLTSLAGELPGRPEVAGYLHGAAEWEPAETFVAWRTEVAHLAEAKVDSDTLTAWFEACPILAQERLRDRTDRVRDVLGKLLRKHRDRQDAQTFDQVVLLNERGQVRLEALSRLVAKPEGRDPLAYATIVLPIEAGGLNEGGMLDPGATEPRDNLDVAEQLPGRIRAAGVGRKRERWLFIRDAEGERWRHLLSGQETDKPPDSLRERARVTLKEPPEGEEDEGQTQALVVWAEPREAAGENPEQAQFRESLTCHHKRVAAYAEQIGRALGLPDTLREALVLAARWHDRGKDRPSWQRYANNTHGSEPLAKSERYGHWRVLGGYRHEFGSLLEAAADEQIASHPQRDLILHLIAAHHGWARPHFEERAFDNEGPTDPASGERLRPSTRDNESMAVGEMQRFGRLQQHFGRWGLAWLESLLRCADALASSAPAAATAADEADSARTAVVAETTWQAPV